MKRRRLWAGLAGTLAVATGVTVWAIQPHPTPATESKTASGTLTKRHQVDVLMQTALLQQSEIHDSKGAADTYGRLLKLDPRNKVAWYNLGVIAQQDDEPDDARTAYDKALKIDPSFTSALFNEAILLKSSDPDRAIELLKKCIAADPKAGTAYLQLGQILAEKDRDDEAGEAFRHMAAIEPSLRSQVPEHFRDSVDPSPTSSQAGSTR
ncbi:tetratricopeptide repeat protein [Streptomyces mirabilis]|uniref:Tetratricopeptide repeat-containing protein n=1 Tax=Streptomyces mirabilis TaxID=68239 RepID=A0A1I2TAA5_9ACTN|nr:tetratricopeptide repeat protein [Streptomyces mirabilis]SFG61772.1 Tetratricopeptide repeat-containing protein [Streptomyces mirabilis]